MAYSQIASLEYDTTQGGEQSCVLIDSTHVVIAYTGSGFDGFIKTFSFDGSYGSLTEISSLEFDIVNGQAISMCKIDATHVAVAFSGNASDGYINIFTIDGSYNITQTSSLEHDTANGNSNSLVLIDSTHLMLAYATTANVGVVKTFSFNPGSSYAITQLDSETFDATQGTNNSLIQLSSTDYAIAYAGASGDGYIQTLSIDGSFIITLANNLEHDTANGTNNALIKISSTKFALAYLGGASNNEATVKTFSVNGSLTITQETSYQYDTISQKPSWVSLGGDYYVLAYAGVDNDGFLNTFKIDATTLAITDVETFEYDTLNGDENSLNVIVADHTATSYLILSYEGDAGDGYVSTFSVTIPLGPSNLKSYNNNVKANIKTINTNLIANVKSLNANT
jgi:hypothetical protein